MSSEKVAKHENSVIKKVSKTTRRPEESDYKSQADLFALILRKTNVPKS